MFYKIIGVSCSNELDIELGICENLDDIKILRKTYKGVFKKLRYEEMPEIKKKESSFYVIGDSCHCLPQLREMVRTANNVNQFIFLGNMVGATPGFLKYMNYLVALSKSTTKNHVFIRGLNESNLLKYIKGEPVEDTSFKSILAFIEEDIGMSVKKIPRAYPEIMHFLKNTVEYYENDKYIFTTSCIGLYPEWKRDREEPTYKIEIDFLKKENKTGKTIFFTMIPARILNLDGRNQAWKNGNRTKVCLNGDPSNLKEGKLLGVYVNDGEINFLTSRNKKTRAPIQLVLV